MNILLTLNRNYLDVALVMLFSLKENNGEEKFNIYILSKDIDASDFEPLSCDELAFTVIKPDLDLNKALTTRRYPEEMYYRLFAFSFLPRSIDKILYLDPDIIINGRLRALYDVNIENNYVAGCTHINKVLTRINSKRLRTEKCKAYLNTGVLLMNLSQIRKDFTKERIEKSILENRSRLLLPDQDVMAILFKDRTVTIDSLKYNLSDRIFTLTRLRGMHNLTLDYVRKNTVIIHYCGKNKPWKDGYHGILGQFYEHYKNRFEQTRKNDKR